MVFHSLVSVHIPSEISISLRGNAYLVAEVSISLRGDLHILAYTSIHPVVSPYIPAWTRFHPVGALHKNLTRSIHLSLNPHPSVGETDFPRRKPPIRPKQAFPLRMNPPHHLDRSPPLGVNHCRHLDMHTCGALEPRRAGIMRSPFGGESCYSKKYAALPVDWEGAGSGMVSGVTHPKAGRTLCAARVPRRHAGALPSNRRRACRWAVFRRFQIPLGFTISHWCSTMNRYASR